MNTRSSQTETSACAPGQSSLPIWKGAKGLEMSITRIPPGDP